MSNRPGQEGWWFKVRENDPQFAGQENGRQSYVRTPRLPRRLWRSLKKSGVGAKFRRQPGVGPYVLDFDCPEHKLAIEIEGSVQDDVVRRDYDAERQAYLESHGDSGAVFREPSTVETIGLRGGRNSICGA